MKSAFFCIDGHTAGNPVRLVVAGGPFLRGRTMAERRAEFSAHHDWIRTGLCFEPRGHAQMSGGFIFPPTREDSDLGILFIETSGCLPMCGHGTIGIVTFSIEHGLVEPREAGRLRIEVPAGLVEATCERRGERVSAVCIRNVPSYLAARDVAVDVPDLGRLLVDVAYGGNYYAIVEPQDNYPGLDALDASTLLRLSRELRECVRDKVSPVHPEDPEIRGVSHVLWADLPRHPDADARNAVFYGDSAIDRSPCGTGTSARMAQLVARGRLGPGERFVHESYIGSLFTGRVEEEVTLGGQPAIVPSIEGSAVVTGYNTIWIDEDDPFHAGFLVD